MSLELIDDFFSFLEDYAEERYAGKDAASKRYLKIGLAIMVGNMLRGDNDENTKSSGSIILNEAGKFYPTGMSWIDAQYKKDYFDDYNLQGFLRPDPGNYQKEKLVLEAPGVGVLSNVSLLYWYWKKSGDYKRFQELLLEWEKSNFAPATIIQLLKLVSNID